MTSSEPSAKQSIARSFGAVRYLTIIAVLGLIATSITTFGVSIAKTVELVRKALRGAGYDQLILVAALEAIDAYLLAVVQLIVVVGLYELFIGDLPLPDWLQARSLHDLKKPIIDVLIVFVAIAGIERFLIAERPMDALLTTASVALLIGSLAAVLAVGSKPSRRNDK